MNNPESLPEAMERQERLYRMTLTMALAASLAFASSAQKYITENTLEYNGEQVTATIDEMAWIQGYWKGSFMGGTFEEVWTPPVNRAMMGAFKQVKGDSVLFYEILTISEENESLVLRIKHFHPDLKGWEARDEVIEWPLVAKTDTRYYFNGLTFEKIDRDHLRLYLAVSFSEEDTQEFVTTYNRQKL